jgi:hypothetical protein
MLTCVDQTHTKEAATGDVSRCNTLECANFARTLHAVRATHAMPIGVFFTTHFTMTPRPRTRTSRTSGIVRRSARRPSHDDRHQPQPCVERGPAPCPRHPGRGHARALPRARAHNASAPAQCIGNDRRRRSAPASADRRRCIALFVDRQATWNPRRRSGGPRMRSPALSGRDGTKKTAGACTPAAIVRRVDARCVSDRRPRAARHNRRDPAAR